ncbi:unnamed protein product [Urochloa decumbens]|uniref:DUF6598 domain-containing protein n=1 Tax=Urochloa decumbens TaxID=240449 RepID=A0ABC9CPC5_9POAL
MAGAGAETEAALKPKAPTWVECQALEKRISLIQQKRADLRRMTKDEKFFSGLSEAEREAKLAKVKEDQVALMREYLRLSSEKRAPDFSGMTEADRAAEAERLRQEAMAEARRLQMAGDPEGLWRELLARFLDFDPKQGGRYYNRCIAVRVPTFNHDEESPIGPMRFTGKVYENNLAEVCEAVNILSVKISCSDVGFPIQVYGTVIVRDCVDRKCLYLFRRDRDHCQIINSKDEPLILTGPKRGLLLLDDNFVETDLKIKDHQGQDREFSKGVISIRGIAQRQLEKCEVERGSLSTRLSTVDVLYAVVIGAVEATIRITVLKGKFDGTITAHTTSIQKRVVLYDSKVAGTRTGKGGVIRLMRYAVSVYVRDLLLIEVKTGDGKSVRTTNFTPMGNSADEDTITVGATKMNVVVAWSALDD